MDVSCNLHAPAALPPDTYWIGGWVGPRVGLDAVENINILHHWESNLGHPASTYIDWAIYNRAVVGWAIGYPDREFHFSSVPLGKYQDSRWISPQLLPSLSFAIHYSSCHSTLYNLTIGVTWKSGQPSYSLLHVTFWIFPMKMADNSVFKLIFKFGT
jgi:hypothetical protein